MAKPIRLLLADDHAAIRLGVRAILRDEPDITVVNEATTGDEAQRLSVTLVPDVLLLDISMPGPPAAETVRFLRAQSLPTRIVVFSIHDQAAVIQRLLSLGANGYVLKDDEPKAITTAIRSVMQGGTYLSPAARMALEQARRDVKTSSPGLGLTERDWQLLRALALGQDDARIATQFGLAQQTVRNYLSRVYAKLGVSSRTEAVAWLHQHAPDSF